MPAEVSKPGHVAWLMRELNLRRSWWADGRVWMVFAVVGLGFGFILGRTVHLTGTFRGTPFFQRPDGTWHVGLPEPNSVERVSVSADYSYTSGPGWEYWTATPLAFSPWPGGVVPPEFAGDDARTLREKALRPTFPRPFYRTSIWFINDVRAPEVDVEAAILPMLRDGETERTIGGAHAVRRAALIGSWTMLGVGVAMVVLRTAWRGLHRFRLYRAGWGRCSRCGYDTRSLVYEPLCPECGLDAREALAKSREALGPEPTKGPEITWNNTPGRRPWL